VARRQRPVAHYQAWKLEHILTDAENYTAFEIETRPDTVVRGDILDIQIDPELGGTSSCGQDGPFSVTVHHYKEDYVAVDTASQMVCVVMRNAVKLKDTGLDPADPRGWRDSFIVGTLKRRIDNYYGSAAMDARMFVRELKVAEKALMFREKADVRQIYFPTKSQCQVHVDSRGEYGWSVPVVEGVVRDIPENGDLNANGPCSETSHIMVPVTALIGRKNGDVIQVGGEYFIVHQPEWLTEYQLYGAVIEALSNPHYPAGQSDYLVQSYFDRCHALRDAVRVIQGYPASDETPLQTASFPQQHFAP
jgi:hypothetical protein